MCESFSHSYQILEEIGRGKFGAVSRCFSPIRHDFFACKVIDKRPLVDPTDRECLENEPKVMTLLSQHPNILGIIDVFDSDDSLCVVTELCRPDTLYDHVVRSLYSEIEAALIVKQLLLALAHCHRLGVVHRDVKPENLLFDSRGNLKLADFGSAVLIQGGMLVEGIVGTPYYVAPEVLMGRMYREKVDVWSAGVIMYIMLSGSPPFNGESVEAVFEAVARGNLRFPPKLFRSISPEAKDLLRKMICRDASKRISAEQALRHPWILSGGETSPTTDEG